MKRRVPFVCLIVLFCLGQTSPQPKEEVTTNQIQNFFQAVEQGSGRVQNWEQIQPLAVGQKISDQMSLESWSRFVNAAAKSGLRSRMVLQVHPLLKQRAYFDEFVRTLGYDSDLWTRVQVFGTMSRVPCF